MTDSCAGLVQLLQARAGVALGLKALLHPDLVTEPKMDWPLVVVAAGSACWYERVPSSPGAPLSFRRVTDEPEVTGRVGYFFGEQDCRLDIFPGTVQPCLVIVCGEERDAPMYAVRVWDILKITRMPRPS